MRLPYLEPIQAGLDGARCDTGEVPHCVWSGSVFGSIAKLEGTWGRVRPLRDQRRALLCGLLGILASVSAAGWLRAVELRESRGAFERRTKEMQLAMRTGFAAPLSTLSSIPPYFAASNAVEVQEFTAFVRTALSRERGSAFIAWAPELAHVERAQFERLANELGWQDFAVRDVASRGGLRQAAHRERYMPMLYVEPRGTPVLGLDLLADPERARAIEHAFREEGPVASPGLDNPQDGPSDSLLVFESLTDVAAHSSDPRSPRRGVAVIALRVAHVLQAAVMRSSFHGLDLVLSDQTPGAPERLLFESSPGASLVRGQPDSVFEQRAQYCGRTWVWRFHAQPGTISAGSSPWILASFGVVLSIAATLGIGAFEIVRRLRYEVTGKSELGQYRLVRKLGEGGMGVVYQAEHTLLRRPTAIKIIASRVVDSDLIARFEREVRATCKLSHPNTIAIYDFGRSPDGVFYYAMEYLPGVCVDTLVQQTGPLPPARVVHLLQQVCGSLSEAHAHGLVHRDVKPGNLMICERGGIADFVKVLDFGLVKDVTAHEVTRYSRVGQVLGTPQYMAPECLRSNVNASPSTDIFAVGAVAYFMLTGHDLVEANSLPELLARQLEGDVEAPSVRLGRPLPAQLEALVMRCLSREPTERPGSAVQLAAALEACELPKWTQADARAFWTAHPNLLAATRPHSGDTAWSATLAVDLDARRATARQSA